jgi:hypothetical protein
MIDGFLRRESTPVNDSSNYIKKRNYNEMNQNNSDGLQMLRDDLDGLEALSNSLSGQ